MKPGFSPLDLHRPANWQAQQSPSKRHRAPMLTRNLKPFRDTSQGSLPQEYSSPPQGNSFPFLVRKNPSATSNASKRSSAVLTPNRKAWDEASWDVIEDQPLRWATDFVPLAVAGSRLVNISVLYYALWSDENRRGRGGQFLAVATKNNILLYETPRGERSFRFVKVRM